MKFILAEEAKTHLVGKVLDELQYGSDGEYDGDPRPAAIGCKIKDVYLGVSQGDNDPGTYLVMDNDSE